MGTVFDPAKDAVNVAKHGVSLGLAAELDWSVAVTMQDVRRDYSEDRFKSFAPLNRRLHVVVYVLRDGAMRVISLCKANDREIDFYERQA